MKAAINLPVSVYTNGLNEPKKNHEAHKPIQHLYIYKQSNFSVKIKKIP